MSNPVYVTTETMTGFRDRAQEIRIKQTEQTVKSVLDQMDSGQKAIRGKIFSNPRRILKEIGITVGDYNPDFDSTPVCFTED